MASDSKMARLDGGDGSSSPTITQTVKDVDALAQRYKALFMQEKFSDIVLLVGKERFFAHRFVLITASVVFEMMLSQQNWKESTQREVKLVEVEECVSEFEHFLGYLYSGEVVLTTNTVLPLLMLADKYEVDSLHGSCLKFMVEHIVQAPDTNRALTWYQYAQMMGQTELRDKCQDFILSNFDLVMKASDWPNMELPVLTDFLARSDMVVHSEAELWKRVQEWLLHENNRDCLEDNLRAVLPFMRFTMMPPDVLLRIEQSLLYNDHKSVFADTINQAHRAHSLAMIPDGVYSPPKSKAKEETEETAQNSYHNREPYRNYTSDEYHVGYNFGLTNFVTSPQGDSHIRIADMGLMHRFICSGRSCPEDKTSFYLSMFTKGTCSSLTYSLYESLYMMGRQKKDHITFKIVRKALNVVPMKVEVTFLLKGKHHNLEYAAFTQSWTHIFKSGKDNVFEMKDCFPVERLEEKSSPYLVDGHLKGTLFLKLQELGAHLAEELPDKDK